MKCQSRAGNSAHAYNLSILEAEAGKLLSRMRPAWATKLVPGQQELQSENPLS